MIQLEWDIIERKLEGKLTSEEETRLEEWLAESEEHRRYFKAVEAFHGKEGLFEDVSDEQADQSWQRLQGRLPGQATVGRRRWYWLASGIAACLVVGLTLLMTWERPVELPVQSAGVLAAGSTKAVLTLSSGAQIDLVEDTSRISEASAMIVNSGKVVSYEAGGEVSEGGEVPVYNKVETPRGGEYQVELPDGSQVYLGAMSAIRFPVRFTGEKRKVEVSGEVYFEVARDTEHPFVVKVDDMEVEVLGTSFNVRNYTDETDMEITLVTGKVKVANDGGEACVLEPSEQVIWNKQTSMMSSRKVDAEAFIDWKNGKLNLRNERLEDILNRLSKWYDIEVFFLNDKARDMRFYANMDRYDNLEVLLKKFELTGRVAFDIKENVVTVRLQ